jgi:hypothetical protein
MVSPAEILNFRISLQNAGFDPVPLAGKRALLPNWVAKRNVPKEEVAAWNASYPAWTNTGLLTSGIRTRRNSWPIPSGIGLMAAVLF